MVTQKLSFMLDAVQLARHPKKGVYIASNSIYPQFFDHQQQASIIANAIINTKG
jgi:hypothetical protein